tara:strand:+ start:173 stop:448 length:276 start_codon:yes stop_codon:yes gene_type:complete
MDELVDLLVKDDSPSQISDKIKDMLYAKSAEKVDNLKPNIANSLFGDQESADELESEVEKAAAVISGEDQTSMRADSEVETEVDTESESEE